MKKPSNLCKHGQPTLNGDDDDDDDEYTQFMYNQSITYNP